jgi:hypothetical protein
MSSAPSQGPLAGSSAGSSTRTGTGGSTPIMNPQKDRLKPNPGLFKNIVDNLNPAIQLSGGSILQLISSLSPLYLSVFFILSSISNGDLKWTMFLAGLIFLVFIFSLAAMTTDAKFEKTTNSAFYKRECNFVSFPYGLSEYTIPNFNSTALSFIFAYIYLPMVQFESYNLVLLSIIIVLFFIDAITKVMNGCTPIVGVLMGMAIGWIVAYLWYLIVAGANSNLIYFNNTNTNPICSRPNNQTFKCKVYKNGEIIHTM